ncbi:hypothetical protein ACFYO7_25085 [Nocardia salmonicida]|uniref:hypothetical protein n=1 Tax=Nocardia salmonicida TaxID=53431 RepID=UPI0036C7565E
MTAKIMARAIIRTNLRILWLLATLVIVGCTSTGENLQEDEFLSKQLADLRQRGGVIRLSDITDPGWDRVYISPQPVSRNFVEKQVGAPVEMEETFMGRGNVLVFLKGTEVLAATYISPDLLTPGMYTAAVRITARGYPSLLEFGDG